MELLRGGMELGDLKLSDTIVAVVKHFLSKNLRVPRRPERQLIREIHGYEDGVWRFKGEFAA